MSQALEAVNQLVEKESKFVEAILQETRKVIVGQQDVLERLLIGLLTGGHLLYITEEFNSGDLQLIHDRVNIAYTKC